MNKIGLLLLTLWYGSAFAQTERPLQGVHEGWQKFRLTNDIVSESTNDFRDFRVYTVSKIDTIETPYLIKENKENKTFESVLYKALNRSSKNSITYQTFALDSGLEVDEFQLELNRVNFDFTVDVYGSFDQKDWYLIQENQRVVGVENQEVSFQYTKVKIPRSNYTYYQLRYPKRMEADMNGIRLVKRVSRQSELVPIEIERSDSTAGSRQIIRLQLDQPLPMRKVHLMIDEVHDYYRQFKIVGVRDVIRNDKGKHYQLEQLGGGVLSSFDENIFQIDSKKFNEVWIEIQNHDNQPLQVQEVKLEASTYDVIARFPEGEIYYVEYGNSSLRAPRYDLVAFEKQIPIIENADILFGKIKKTDQKMEERQMLNSKWLYLIMGIVILALGYGSIRMIRSN